MSNKSEQLSYKNLRLLWWLRNVAIIGQSAAILVVTKILAIPLPTQHLWEIIVGLAVFNCLAWKLTSDAISKERVIRSYEFFAYLLIDIAALAGVLYQTGGATNPFAFLFILQVVIAAVILPARYAWATAVIATITCTSLMIWKIEMPYFLHHHIGDFFNLHVQGMWISFMLVSGIISWFIVRMNATIQRQAELLAEAEKIGALGTLATSAAHELGTPLATMAIMAEDLDAKQAKQFSAQIQRCKQILSRITAASGVARAEGGSLMQLEDFFNKLIENWQKNNSKIKLKIDVQNLPNVKIVAEYALEQAIVNLLDNAADASPKYVKITIACEKQILRIAIIDKGDGVAAEIYESLGELGVTTKQNGLGMGFFLARSVVNRLDGSIEIVPVKAGKGSVATIIIPLKRIMV